MAYSLAKLKKELSKKIDMNSQVQKEKVVRYLNLVELFYTLDEYVKTEGPVVVTENGAQRFVKVNPAIQEKNRINVQLLAIEKSFEFSPRGDPDEGCDLI